GRERHSAGRRDGCGSGDRHRDAHGDAEECGCCRSCRTGIAGKMRSDVMDKIIRIEDFTYTYPGAQQPTLTHVSLEIEKGDFLAVVGNNGCGKSTLCKVLNGLIPHFI